MSSFHFLRAVDKDFLMPVEDVFLLRVVVLLPLAVSSVVLSRLAILYKS